MRYQSYSTLAWFVGLMIACAGCNALHVPQSEIMLFEQHKDPEESTQGLSVSSAMTRTGFRQYALRQNPGAGRMWLLDRNLWSLSYKRGFSTKRVGAIGFAVGGAGIGVDWTYAFREKLYVTAMGNIHQNYALILQHPVVRHDSGGLGIGVYARSDRHGLTRCETAFLCYVDEPIFHFRVSSAGIRMAHYIDDEKGRLRSRLWLGYSPEIERVVFAVALGISINP